jgi:hypothetical protein
LSIPNELLWQREAFNKKQVRKWLLRVLSGLIVLLIIAWALITQPMLPNLSARKEIPTVDAAKLEAHVRMLAEQIVPRDGSHPQNLNRAADYIRLMFANPNGRVTEQSYYARGHAYRNIIASFGPETGERIIVGAHYDAAGPKPGSDDNASGVAGLLELAYLLGNTPPHIRVDLAAYSLEEYFGTKDMGSIIHAQSLKQQNTPIRLMISLEMIGYFSDAPDSQALPISFIKPFYPMCGNFIAVVGSLGQWKAVRRVKSAMRSGSDLPVYSLNAPRSIPGVDWSDHFNFWDAGYDAVMVTDTAFLRNTRYHTVNDTPDTLDYKRMAMVVQGVYAAVLGIAQE